MPEIRRYLMRIKSTNITQISPFYSSTHNIHTVPTHCLCKVGLIKLIMNAAHIMPMTASVQYALMKMGWRAGIFGPGHAGSWYSVCESLFVYLAPTCMKERWYEKRHLRLRWYVGLGVAELTERMGDNVRLWGD
jgi:hypothetical protein